MKNLLIIAVLALSSFDAAACKGKTKDGRQCSRKAVEYCKQHDTQAPRCGAPTKSGEPCKRLVKVAGSHCKPHSK